MNKFFAFACFSVLCSVFYPQFNGYDEFDALAFHFTYFLMAPKHSPHIHQCQWCSVEECALWSGFIMLKLHLTIASGNAIQTRNFDELHYYYIPTENCIASDVAFISHHFHHSIRIGREANDTVLWLQLTLCNEVHVYDSMWIRWDSFYNVNISWYVAFDMKSYEIYTEDLPSLVSMKTSLNNNFAYSSKQKGIRILLRGGSSHYLAVYIVKNWFDKRRLNDGRESDYNLKQEHNLHACLPFISPYSDFIISLHR